MSKKFITDKQLKEMIRWRTATFICYTGLQKRPVYRIGNELYEKAIEFDDGEDHSHYWQVSHTRAAEILTEELHRESVRTR